MKKSRASRWRAAVLIGVHALIAAHVVQWLVQGVTVSPVEPSESMYTLEAGEINAGFIFFAIAIVSTVVFGRFFCGWGCHVVALQDWCSHLMGKLGVRPKPFRSRLLVWAPVALACYMFAWPTVRREVVLPLVHWTTTEVGVGVLERVSHVPELGRVLRAQRVEMPFWMGQTQAFPGLRNAVMVEDFWATFPPWYVAVPFLLVCGFATVYFLGSKGFCTYGCPYGGIFGPVDRISVGRIVVSDACEGCGHCTATCTSNVRVHQEVRDYGMVVDPGCMKCMDCVSVCPNQALSFKFAAPSILAKPRTKEAKAGRARRPEYDLSMLEEVWVCALGVVLTVCFRGMFDQVPLLMAVAMGGIGAFCAWKLWRLVRTPNVRMQSLQLRSKGAWTWWGRGFAIGTAALLVLGAWSGAVRSQRWWGENLDARILTSQDVVFAKGYIPTPEDASVARRAIAALTRGGSVGESGWGWRLTPALNARVAWLAAVAGDRAKAERHLVEALRIADPSEEVVLGLRSLMGLRSASNEDFIKVLDQAIAARPTADHARIARGYAAFAMGDAEGGFTQFRAVLASPRKADDLALQRAIQAMAQAGRGEEALRALEAILPQRPSSFTLRDVRAGFAMGARDEAGVLRWLREAAALQPGNPVRWRQIQQLYLKRGDGVGAAEAEAMATRAERRLKRG
jgi:polyferredoxin